MSSIPGCPGPSAESGRRPLGRRPGAVGHRSLRASAGSGPAGTRGGGDSTRSGRNDSPGPGPITPSSTSGDIILGCDWISCGDLRFLYPQGRVARGGTQAPLSTPLRPSVPSAARAAVKISHGDFRRKLRSVVPTAPTQTTGASRGGAARLQAVALDSHLGMSKPRGALGAINLASADRQRELRRAPRRAPVSRPSPAPSLTRTIPRSSLMARSSTSLAYEDDTALLTDGTELHLAHGAPPRVPRLGGIGSPGLRCSQRRVR